MFSNGTDKLCATYVGTKEKEEDTAARLSRTTARFRVDSSLATSSSINFIIPLLLNNNIKVIMDNKGTNPPAEGVINADAFTFADVAPVVEASKHEKTKKPITFSSILHKSKKIANNAVAVTKDAANSAVVTLKEVDEKHQVSSTTMAAASSATEKTRSAVSSIWAKGGGEKKKNDETTSAPTTMTSSAPTTSPIPAK